MTELSPAAIAVDDVLAACIQLQGEIVRPRPLAAAALQAAADQADPKRHVEDISYQHQLYVDGWKDCLEVIRDIADELEAQ
jgi:hypothetical protein